MENPINNFAFISNFIAVKLNMKKSRDILKHGINLLIDQLNMLIKANKKKHLEAMKEVKRNIYKRCTCNKSLIKIKPMRNNPTNEEILKDSLDLAKSALGINTATGTAILKRVLSEVSKMKDEQARLDKIELVESVLFLSCGNSKCSGGIKSESSCAPCLINRMKFDKWKQEQLNKLNNV